MAFLLEPHQYH